ncbi:MAG TPA: hypothetical protein VE999_11885 [Gemmataceae bacterium]|nr:hypothetical protein [Gemmataceae bacterium]
MDNRIRQIIVRDYSLVPAQAEVWITVVPEQQTSTTEVHGRLMGPRCPYASTIEVAYPLRPLSPSQKATEQSGLTVRVIIPEASLWEPQCPFLYQGPIELWQDGQRCERVSISHGLRSLRMKERVLYVNDRPLTLRGIRIDACSDDQATQLHQTGYNLLIAPVASSNLTIWEQADRFGFLVLGQLDEDADETRLVEMLRSHASCLGWFRSEYRAASAEEAIDCFLTSPQR